MASKREAKAAIGAWFERVNKRHKVVSVSHVNIGYVVGYAAPLCIVVAVPWMTAEPQMKEFTRENPLNIYRDFDKKLRPGDWCLTGYVSTETCGFPVAIPMLAEREKGGA